MPPPLKSVQRVGKLHQGVWGTTGRPPMDARRAVFRPAASPNPFTALGLVGVVEGEELAVWGPGHLAAPR